MSNSKSAGIYSITSKINGKRYIGSSIRICDRWKEHLKKLQTNKHTNKHLQNHYDKHGEDDLLFAVVEVLERGDLFLGDFKSLLLECEQTYLDSWQECHFNCMKTAGSILGYKHTNSKHYYFNKERNNYKVSYNAFGETLWLGTFNTEQEAQEQVAFIKTLTDDELLKYYEINHKGKGGAKVGQIYRDSKCYSYNKTNKNWRVYCSVDGRRKHFGYYKTEKEAQQKAEQIKKELGGFD